MAESNGKKYRSEPSDATMKDLEARGYRSGGYKFPLWVDATDALSPKEMEKEEKRWLKQNPARAGATEANTPKAEAAHEKRLSKSSGRMGGGGGGMMPDIEKIPGKRPLKMAKGGAVKSSTKYRGDGICKKGHTKGRMV